MIHLFSQDTRICNMVRDAVAGTGAKIDYQRPNRRELPKSFDFVVTPGQINTGVERFAAQYGAWVVVLPEAQPWLSDQMRAGRVMTLLGSDYRDVRA